VTPAYARARKSVCARPLLPAMRLQATEDLRILRGTGS
jgi:hypothetical protein